MIELIEHENSMAQANSHATLMCFRGLLMLLQLEHLSDYAWLRISKEILSALNRISNCQVADHENKTVQFLLEMPNIQLLEYVMSLQSLLTINILGEQINFPLFEDTIKFLDILFKVNKIKPKDQQILDKEFNNDAINNSVELKTQMFMWAKQTKD